MKTPAKRPEPILPEDAPKILADTIPKIGALGRALESESRLMLRALLAMNLIPAPPAPPPVIDKAMMGKLLDEDCVECRQPTKTTGSPEVELAERALALTETVSDAAQATMVITEYTVDSEPVPDTTDSDVETADESANMEQLARAEEARISTIPSVETSAMPTEEVVVELPSTKHTDTLRLALHSLFTWAFSGNGYPGGNGKLEVGVAGLKQYRDSVYNVDPTLTAGWPTGFYRGPERETEFFINHPTMQIRFKHLFGARVMEDVLIHIRSSAGTVKKTIGELAPAEAYLVGNTIKDAIGEMVKCAVTEENTGQN